MLTLQVRIISIVLQADSVDIGSRSLIPLNSLANIPFFQENAYL